VKEENPDKRKASAAPGASRLKLSLAVLERRCGPDSSSFPC